MLKLIYFELLDAAVVLSEELGYRQAAQRLGISQDSLSKRIAALEDQLEFQIFQKHFKQVTVTPEGNAFIGAARSFLSEVKRIKSPVEDESGKD